MIRVIECSVVRYPNEHQLKTNFETFNKICRFLVNDQRDPQFLSMYLFLILYMFRAHRAHRQERQIVSIQLLVAVTLCRWPCRVQVEVSLPTCTRHGHRQLPEVVLTQFVSPDDEHDVLGTCRELKI